MDALKRTWRQFADLFAAMSPSQRLTLVAVPALLLAAFAVLAHQGRSSSYVPLSWGKVFTGDQLRSAEQTLIEAGLTQFKSEGQRILVPSAEVERYNAALLVNGDLPSDSMSEFQKQYEKSSVFASREQLTAMKEIALQNELRNVLRALPDVEDASVTWARSDARRWPDRPGKVTATVSLRPRRGRPLEPRVVRSIRGAAVAGMVPDLAAESVTVFDQSTGTAFDADRDGPFDSELVRWIDEHTENYRRRIAGALSYIPDVIVSVNVDVENLKSQIVREQTVDSKQTVAVETSDMSRSTESAERSSSGEPGATSNTPRQLQVAAGPTRSVNNKETDSTSRVVPSYTLTEKQFLTAMPKAVQVSISIPEDYHRQVALARGVVEGTGDAEKAVFLRTVEAIRLEEELKVRRQTLMLIPAGSPEEAVNVASVTRLEPKTTVVALPWTERMTDFVKTWGGTLGLGLLAAWGLLMLSKATPKSVMPEAENPAAEEAAAETPMVPQMNKRDALQAFVRSNPEATAAVVGQWVATAR